ncbi:flagellar hook-length control protein FliK [Phenylobacterium sp.]|uniref:flagellar hook-length control protein FliK n=1 Tax=Phenylobacterium sp. TaxID=1871053 RepID=UPI002E2F53CA|nr:flagellar hook-length control protein FliK [Phenylobacterium sp.]HEX3366796.1 flagellar hook-length control protein FliK [Phenylobacterium sp.]
MNISPISAVVAVLQAEVADLMARDLSLLGEIVGKPSAVTPAATQTTATQTTATTQAAATTQALAPTPNAPDSPPANAVAQAVTVARADAAGRQAGLAPLMADLAQVEESPALPAAVRAAIGQVLNLQTPLDGPLTAQVVARAVAQSGLFLEAHLAANPGAPVPPDVKAALLTLQQALSPQAEAPAPPQGRPNPAAAPPIAQPATAAPSSAPPPSGAVQQAPAAASAPLPPPPDLKAAVQTLQQVLAAPPEETAGLPAPLKAALAQVLTPPPSGAPGVVPPQTFAKAAAQLAPLLDAYLAAPEEEVAPEVRAALQTLQETLNAPADDRPALPPRASPPSPPARDGAITAQAAARPSLPEHADAQLIAQVLSRGVDQALARLTLHQLASLPDGPNQAWTFELPVATPQGAAIAQFQVDRDAGAGGGGEGDPGWRVRFSIDIEPLGPVHVQLAPGAERASVTVWAERPDGLVRLRSLGGELARALPADVRFQGGSPRQAAATAGRFVDQTS